MSLAIWLPLNGDLTNQGLSNVTVTNNGATIDNNGKIGKCYKFDGDVYLNLSKGIDTTKDYSICYWVKEFENNTLSQFRVVYQCGGLIVGQYGKSLDIYNSWSGGFDVMAAIDTTIWHHACFTFQSSENLVTIYIDGKYATSKTVTSIPASNSSAIIGKRSDDGTYLFQGSLNDFRIYDHALSAKEVGELAKGLVLHYRLAGPGQENLVTSLSAGGRTSVDGTYAVHTSKTNADTYFYANLSSSLNPGEKVTVSCDVSGFASNDYQWNFPFWSQNSGLAFWLKNGHCSQTFTVPSGVSASNRIIFDDNGVINGFTRGDSIIYIKNFKIERGSVSTPWCPNPVDPLYHTMGYDNNIEYDCSGYKNNGVKNGAIIWDASSPRYTTSYNFSPQTTITTNTGFPVGSNTIFTFNIWLKTPSGKTMTQYGDYSSIKGSNLRIETDSTNGLNLWWFNYPIGTLSGIEIGNMQADSWYMHTLVCDGTKFYIYLNGELKSTTILSGTAFTTNGGLTLGDPSSAIMYFNLSDCRVYATALSAEDIAELYHSAVIVDNTGKSYAYEYFEAQ